MQVAHLVIETAFGDDERQLARISATCARPRSATSWRSSTGSVDVHITHIKPGEMRR